MQNGDNILVQPGTHYGKLRRDLYRIITTKNIFQLQHGRELLFERIKPFFDIVKIPAAGKDELT